MTARRNRGGALVCGLLAAALAVIICGCTQPPAHELVLTHTPLTKLFPGTADYAPIDPSVKWFANEPSDIHVSKAELKVINAPTSKITTAEYGAACARLLNHPPRVSWLEVGQQTVDYGQTVEVVSILRSASIESAERSQAARVAEMDVCSSSQGSSVFKTVNAEVPGSAAFLVSNSTSGESDFVAYGRVGQFEIEVTGVYADGPTIGAGTFKTVMTRVNALARHEPATTPTIAAPQPLQTPAPQVGQLARLTTGPSVDFVGTGLALPPSKHGYEVIWACSSADPTAQAGWELDDINNHNALIEASSGSCDGSGHQDEDASLTDGYKAVHFHLTGDYDGSQMYAILVPAGPSQ